MSVDKDLETKVRKTSEKISENMHIVANEPSLAFFRIQEHVRKVLPLIVDRRSEVVQLQQDLQGHCYDMEYAIGAIKSIEASEQSFQNIHELLKNAIFLKQQLKYEETRRTKKEPSNSSVYKRLSAHITLELPDLPDISGVVRETTNRVENMMSHARNSSSSAAVPTNGATELQRSHTTLH
uniref:Protein MEF2BNB homolog n=2 Tax=Lutzomyia longipalpis TaxID=7200 RepID=A0A1B0CQW8_LUTLO